MLGDTLKYLRLSKKLSRKDIEQKLGITERNIKSYELGTSKPSLDVLVKLADFYEVSTDYLLGREEQKFVEDVSKMSDNELDKKLMQFFIQLPEKSKQGIRDFVMSLVSGLSGTESQPQRIVQTKEPEPQTFKVKEAARHGQSEEKTLTKECLDFIEANQETEDSEL